MNSRIILLTVAAGVSALVTLSTAAEHTERTEALPVLKPKVKTVAAFKNGLAFVFRSGETPLKDGWARMDQLPTTTLGTLWIGTTSKSGPVTDVIAYKEKVRQETDAISMGEMLAANIGRKVILSYAAGTATKVVEGVLFAVPEDRKADENALPTLNPQPYYGSYIPPGPQPARAEIVLLKNTTADGQASLLSLVKSSVQSLEAVGDFSNQTKVEKELARTKIRVGGSPRQAEITVAGLEKGIVWSPSYRINLANEKQADIELEAVFANDMEDLEDAEVSFVVGYPNFSFADVVSPISLQQSVANFVQALANGGNTRAGRFDNNVMSQAILFNGARFDGAAGPDAGYAAGLPLPGEQGEDLYFYHKAGITMKKGDRALFSILKTTAPYEHIYQWEILDSMNVDDRGYRLNAEAKPANLVWHVLRLENKGKQPWTTAPAFALNGQLPVAQDTLTYTPPGGRSTLKLTVATDVRAEQTQTEVARKQVNVAGRHYDEVMVTGKLKLTNWKAKEIAMVIRKSVVGEVVESPDGKVAKLVRNLTAVNPSSEVEWEFNLPAGKDRELTYQYKVLLAL
jgi:hypothetical protein